MPASAATTAPEWALGDFVHQGWWWRNKGILQLNLCLFLPILIAWTNGLDGSLVNSLQLLPDWQEFFGEPTGVMLGLIGSAQNVSALPFAPYASDLVGRRMTLFSGSLGMLLGVILQITAPTVKIFIAARIIVGFFLNICLNAAPLLVLELSYPTQRGKITSLFNSCWYVGAMVSAWTCFATYNTLDGDPWSWRIPTFLQAVVPALHIVLIWFIPESPRFLVAKGRESEAAAVLAKYHANGGSERHPLVLFEIAQIRHALRMEEAVNKSTTYLTLFATSGNRKRMLLIAAIAVFSQWSGNGLVSYYLDLVLDNVGISDVKTKTALNGGLMIWNMIVAIGASFFVDRFGRRLMFIWSTVGMLLIFTFWTLTTALVKVRDDHAARIATIPLIFLFYAAYNIAYSPLLYTYVMEILPYKIRAKGFAFMHFVIFLVLAFNQLVNPIAMKDWKYYLFYVAWLAFELVFILWKLVETKGHTLEETAALFDGPEAHQELVAIGGQQASISLHSIPLATNSRHHVALAPVTSNESRSPRSMLSSGVKSTVRFAANSELELEDTLLKPRDFSQPHITSLTVSDAKGAESSKAT
ncbi:hypothetical protein DL96DRAFT_1467428 [Flagelloscypha sp. PMI_526]|nr:hypothetical protein DL96DRAFT_1467428 [Flagelloscypha sp. PMI_526]